MKKLVITNKDGKSKDIIAPLYQINKIIESINKNEVITTNLYVISGGFVESYEIKDLD